MNWTQFVQRIPIQAPVERIYPQFVTQSGLEYWFLRQALFFKPDGSVRGSNEPVEAGDTYSWLWHGYGEEAEEKGRILECNGADMLRFTFADPCEVTIRIKSEKNHSLVELLQENIPTDDKTKMKYYVGCSTGWVFYLANLKSLLEGGLDLRNKDMELQQVLNA